MSAELERQIAALMKTCGVDREGALEILEDDKRIDRGERMDFDLPPEQERLAKKFANVTEHKKPTTYEFTKRQRKENPTKADIIKAISEFLPQMDVVLCENVAITNKERQIAFSVGDNSFELTLVQKRKPKN